MKKSLLLFIALFLITPFSKATIHVVLVWDGYFQFIEPESPFIVELGDTIQWLPFDFPMMVHTITSSDIPNGAATFDYTWQAPADTFFQYVPTVLGEYDYVCTPHEVSYGMVGNFTVVEGTTSIADGGEESRIALFPNPASDRISIDLSGLESKEWTVHLMDHTGRQLDVLYQGIVRSENQTIVESVDHLGAGVYYVLIESDGIRHTRRLVKH